MSAGTLGPIVLALAVAAAALSPPPDDPVAVAVLGLGALGLERFGLQLEANYRLSPAAPAYLAMGMLGEVGAWVAGLVLVVDGLSRLGTTFWANLGGKLGVGAGLLSMAIAAKAVPQRPEIPMLVGPALYLAIRLGLEGKMKIPENRKEALIWMQLHLRVRPLEIALAVMAPALAAACQVSPLWGLALLPLLASSHLAAENVLLRANDQTLEGVLKELKGARSREMRAARELDETRREKQLLEGFSAHLATHPSLQSVAASLVSTVFELMTIDTGAVFLGSPPDPFSYRTSAAQTERLQAAAMTGLREPVVDRAWSERRPALQKEKPPQAERLLPDDLVAAAVPLATLGVLYVARSSSRPFEKKDLERLQWLAGKAQLALEAGFQANQEARQRREQQETVKQLERKVAWLATLLSGAEAFASTLDREALLERFLSVLKQVVKHQQGVLVLASGREQHWGGELAPQPELVKAARATGRPVSPAELKPSGPGTSRCPRKIVASPLTAHQQCLGVAVLATDAADGFSDESLDLLFLLCSQAAMALSNAAHFAEVEEARRRLEESQAQLVQSSKMTALGQLAAGVAHELNSPIGAIALCLDVASSQMQEKPDLAARLLVKGQEALARSKEIINRLLAYSRKPSHERQPVSMKELAEDTLDFLAYQLKDRGLQVDFSAQDEGLVMGEPQPLQQVLTNLILNAAQACQEVPEERRRLNIQVASGGGEVRLSVTDHGEGIRPEHLSRIFEPFFTTKPIGAGTGLGLWATHQIVTQHDGQIDVQSQLGRGTTFTVTLPARS